MNRNLTKYIIIAILYIIMIIEIIVVIHTFGHYKKVEESANISQKMSNNINNTQVEEQEQPGNIEKVKERNDFYTAVSCVNKYLEYLNNKDAQAVYNCLDQVYIEKKEITENNVLNKFEDMDSKYVFKAEKMFQQKIGNGIIQYYAYGKLTENTEVQDSQNRKDFYISIIINRKTGAFTLLPDTYIN